MAETLEATAVAGFRIEGEYLTSLMRDMVREGKWRKAYDILLEGLNGISADVVLDVLRGAKKLIGTNDLDVAQDNAEPLVKEWLDYKLRGCFAFRGRVYRAYGYVGAYQQKDYQLAQEISRGEDEQMQQNRMWRKADAELSEEPRLRSFNPWKDNVVLPYRPAFYARCRSRDICIMVNLNNAECRPVLCEEVEHDIPLWYKLPTDAAVSIREDFAKGHLPDLFEPTMDVSSTPVKTASKVVTPVAKQEADKKEEALAQKAEETQAARVERMRADIVAFADTDPEYGWLELKDYDDQAGRNVQLKVPHRAFICAALDRAKAHHLMPEYSPRCPSGLKLLNDDPYHSDAWLGAGMELRDAYNRELPEQRLFMDKLYALQREKLGFTFDVLSRGSEEHVIGDVIHDPELAHEDKILVLKTAAPEYAPAALKCKAVIVETGSKLAHLVVVSREEAVPVIRAEQAVNRFIPGQRLCIDFSAGKVSLLVR